MTDLQRNRSRSLDAPSWLWNSVVEFVAAEDVLYQSRHARDRLLSLYQKGKDKQWDAQKRIEKKLAYPWKPELQPVERIDFAPFVRGERG